MKRRALLIGAVLSVVVVFRSDATEPLMSFDDLSLSRVTRSVTGTELRLACLRRDPPPALSDPRETTCRQTVGAVLDSLDMVEAAHPAARMYCPAVRPVPWQEAADVFVAWANRNRDKLNAPSVWVLMDALAEAYPCPKGSA